MQSIQTITSYMCDITENRALSDSSAMPQNDIVKVNGLSQAAVRYLLYPDYSFEFVGAVVSGSLVGD